MRNRILVLLVACVLLLSCKSDREEIEKNRVREQSDVDSLNTAQAKSKPETKRCEDYVFQIVKSSDLELNDYPEYFVRIESIENDEVKIQVYVENNISDNPEIKQMVESTIAWLVFVPNESKLLNITADPEFPTEVHFNKKIVTKNIFESCNINFKPKKENNKIDCQTNQLEMGQEEVCRFKNAVLKDVYFSIIQNKEVDGSHSLKKELPSKSDYCSINSDGLIAVEYKITKDQAEIRMSFDGGETTIVLKQTGNDVKRTIVYSAD
ncbi:hypothetical protein [Flavobacterium sp. H122]|uniref:hypothetical protein n=1 Tax=Flavobacterium sp. H122 TaxID=2529860 RepID=UPI0010AB08CC|nr:hypothetical protein [Flavobacterium sp. H122]